MVRIVCLSLQVHAAHFGGAGGANRVLVLSLVFCPLERHLRGAGWGGLAAIAARFMHHLGQLTARADASER